MGRGRQETSETTARRGTGSWVGKRVWVGGRRQGSEVDGDGRKGIAATSVKEGGG